MADTGSPDTDSRDLRIGRILNEFHDRRARGEHVSEAELLAAHPDLADELREHLDTLGDLRPADEKIEGLIAQGILAESTDPKYAAELGAYQIIEFIGRGGMGIVLLAYEESLNRTVALKILRPELADDAHALKRFGREAKAAAALNHPNIVTVHAVGEERGVHFLAMQYIEGPTLSQVIREQGPLPAETARRLFGQLLSGLEAAHGAALIHRDVKASNLLIDCGSQIAERGLNGDRPDDCESGISPASSVPPAQSSIVNRKSSILKLADFGLARMLTAQTRLTLSDSILGTAEYMSPEQAQGDSELDQRTDLYSAGVVLYEMLTGRTPFQADSPSAVIHRILHEDPADPRTISKHADPHLASLALRLMAKRPADRFASATEAIQALEGGERVQSLERRRRWRRRVLAGLMVVVALAFATWPAHYLATRAGEISDVRVDPDVPRTIQVRYGGGMAWKPFYEPPPDVSLIRDVELVDLDASGRLAIIVALATSPDGRNVLALDPEGNELWRWNPSTTRQWPDCGPPTQWNCARLLANDLDDEPGAELLAIACDAHEYATRLSLIDPRTGKPRSTFWHMGVISDAHVQADFFGPGRPAIIAWGQNNKLDGFNEPVPTDEAPLTQWDRVSVVMILDPAEMAGLGPPRTSRREVADLPEARLHAYACLDLPAAQRVRRATVKETRRLDRGHDQVTGITDVLSAHYTVDDRTGPWFTVLTARGDGSGGAILTVNRNLRLRRVLIGDTEAVGIDETYWRARWRPIIQNGKYLRE
jgi:serine/threonine protein kinase